MANGLLVLATQSGYSARNNDIDHNLFINCDDAGLNISSSSIGNRVEFNSFKNNIIYNCGLSNTNTNTKYSNIGLTVGDFYTFGDNQNVGDNIFFNNLIFNDFSVDDVIWYHGQTINTTLLNNSILSQTFNDNIQDNINNTSESPVFNDNTFSTGYKLHTDSICIDNGYDTSSLYSYCFYNNNNFLGSSSDIGVHEKDNTTLNNIKYEFNNYSVFPTIVEDKIIVKIKASFTKKTPIILFNVFGQKLKQYSMMSNPFVIETSYLPAGIYLLRIGEKNESVKFIKK